MDYYLFLDESGDHGLKNLDPNFPVFALCGIIISSEVYTGIDACFNDIKKEFWGNKKVIFHSRDIRKCDKEFQIFFDKELKSRFYEQLNSAIENCDYTVISSVIEKENYIKKYGKLRNDVYEIALSFIIERSIFYLDSVAGADKHLRLIIEQRGKKEDAQLKRHIERLIQVGTYYLKPERIKAYNIDVTFRSKKENINGLQISDLVAYPIARYCLDPERANPAYDIVKSKIYKEKEKVYGLKVFP